MKLVKMDSKSIQSVDVCIPYFSMIISTKIYIFHAACDCNVLGSNSQICKDSGQCDCKVHIEGIACDHCKDTYFGFPNCQPCQCNEKGSDGQDCNVHGICTCMKNVAGDKCDTCSKGYTGHPTCHQCDDTYFGYPDCQGMKYLPSSKYPFTKRLKISRM